MSQLVSDHSTARAELLAAALADTIADLRLIEAGDMIGYISSGQWANIADLVASSSELFLREGALSFACMADFALGWGTTPSISLELEFQAATVSAFFTLVLGRRESLVDLKAVWFADSPADEDAGTALLARAVQSARLHSDANRTSA